MTVLSIIVISHNQREELQRCLDSILAQKVCYPYEIIVSDDRSTDGSAELAEEYVSRIAEWQTTDEFLTRMIALRCNSDDIHPVNNSHRSGWNRCNAYPYAQGKYIAHVDADDYFRAGAQVYNRQIAALESHPDCALAMSNCLWLADNEPIEKATPWPFPREMHDGEVINAVEFVRGDYFRLNQCFMQRRNADVDPVKLYGRRYVDSVITYHHLQFGDVIYVDACDYVYIKAASSITEQLWQQSMDHKILWCLGLYIPALIPSLSQIFFMGAYYQEIRDVVKMALRAYKLQPQNARSFADLHCWIFDCFSRDISFMDKLRLHTIDFLMKLMKKTGLEPQWGIRLLRKLLFAE